MRVQRRDECTRAGHLDLVAYQSGMNCVLKGTVLASGKRGEGRAAQHVRFIIYECCIRFWPIADGVGEA
jgi:hypothetical protein